MTQVFLPGFVLNANSIFVQTTTLEFSVSDGASLTYALDPNGAVNDFGIREATLTGQSGSIDFGLDFDEAFVANFNLASGGALPVVSFYNLDLDQDFVVFLDNTAAIPTTQAQLDALLAQVVSVSTITTGPFRIGTPIDLTALPTATLSQDDVFQGGPEDDYFEGGAGDDDIDGGAGNDTLFGGADADDINGAAGDDTLDGGDDDDRLWGGDGNDTLFGREGMDLLSGGAGADLLNGNRGFDFANYSDSSAAVTVDLRTGTGSGGDAEGDTLVSIEGLEGSAYADTLMGYIADEILTGLDGGDTLRGKGGDDTLFGGNGADRVNGGVGNDTLFGEFGDDILQGRGGDDILWGGNGQDSLKGHGGDDRLNGEDGNDHIEGKGGNDTLTGGAGADNFVFEKNRFGNDVITDFEDDIDTIELVESLWGGGLTAAQMLATYATQDGADVDFDFGTATLVVQNVTLAALEDDLIFV